MPDSGFSYLSAGRRVTISLVVVMTLSCSLRVSADRRQAADLVEQARELIAAEDYQPARQVLTQAIAADDHYPEIYVSLGYLGELTDTKEQALTHYGRALQLKPDHTYARQRFRHLFFAGRFPRWVSLDLIKYSPVSVVVDSCQVTLTDAVGRVRSDQRRFAYSTSLLFPEEMGRGDPALRIRIPAAGQAAGPTTVVNRVTYGWQMAPDTNTLHLRFALYYPSATVSSAGKDYSQLSQLLMHMLLRFAGYGDIYLGRQPPGDEEGLVRVYLCEDGPTGAEQYQHNIYLYDVAQGRSVLEWTREIAHELGHALLPPVGRFDEPEPWGNGEVGERLFLQWLAAEASQVSGYGWPSAPAQDALAALCSGQSMDLHSYIADQCRPLLDFWLREGPESPLIAGTGRQSLDHFLGFCLWVQAAHGPRLLAQVLDASSGTSIPDFGESYQTIVRRRLASDQLFVRAGAVHLPNSHLSQIPSEGALARREVMVGAQDVAVLPVFLPAGVWQVVAVCQPNDAQLHLVVQIGQQRVEALDEISIAVGKDGWHQIRITVPGASEAVQFHGVIITALPQV